MYLSKLSFNGLNIERSNVINIGEGENDFPMFVLVKMMIKVENNYKLIVEKLNVINLNTDVSAYEVAYTNNFYTLNLNPDTINCTFTSCVSQVFSNFYVSWI